MSNKTYSDYEIELNKKLFEECSKRTIDFNVVEELLKNGADPLGPTDVKLIEEHLYGELITVDHGKDECKNLPEITEIFLKHGMDISKPRVPYDDDNSINPLWMFSFRPNEKSAFALKMLLDNGLDADSAGEFWDHSTFDLINVDCTDPNKEFSYYYDSWTMRMIMLIASYDHILNEDEDLRNFLGCAYNDYDLKKFRNWNDFIIEFDTSTCERFLEFYRSIIRFYEKTSKNMVWKIGVCFKEKDWQLI